MHVHVHVRVHSMRGCVFSLVDMVWDFHCSVDVDVLVCCGCRYYCDFLHSIYHYKHQVDILTSSTHSVYLSDVLYNDTALSYFMQVIKKKKTTDVESFVYDVALAVNGLQKNRLSVL